MSEKDAVQTDVRVVTMRVVSVNVGRPRSVPWHAKTVVTSIWKDPVAGPVAVAGVNLDGDDQSDRRVHGGPNKAIYGYPTEHYEYWRRELPDADLPWGAFGENLTTAGLLESDVAVGDRYRVGSVELIVTQPRIPCFKLGIRFGREDIIKRFLESRRSGFYFAIAKDGQITAGDTIQRLTRNEQPVTIAQILAMFVGDISDPGLARRAIANQALPEFWKEELRALLRS